MSALPYPKKKKKSIINIVGMIAMCQSFYELYVIFTSIPILLANHLITPYHEHYLSF